MSDRLGGGTPDWDCYGCAKVERHHRREEAGTVCTAHGFGPACDPEFGRQYTAILGEEVRRLRAEVASPREWRQGIPTPEQLEHHEQHGGLWLVRSHSSTPTPTIERLQHIAPEGGDAVEPCIYHHRAGLIPMRFETWRGRQIYAPIDREAMPVPWLGDAACQGVPNGCVIEDGACVHCGEPIAHPDEAAPLCGAAHADRAGITCQRPATECDGAHRWKAGEGVWWRDPPGERRGLRVAEVPAPGPCEPGTHRFDRAEGDARCCSYCGEYACEECGGDGEVRESPETLCTCDVCDGSGVQ